MSAVVVGAVVASDAARRAAPAVASGGGAFGSWTILGENSDLVRAVVTREHGKYVVRDERGAVLGRYAGAEEALASVCV